MSQALPHCDGVNSAVNERISERYLTRPDNMSHISDLLSLLHDVSQCADMHKDMELSSTVVQSISRALENVLSLPTR